MRRRELVRRLKDDRSELIKESGGIFSSYQSAPQRAERRLVLLHSIERLLPEIIKKLQESRS
jgi:hypothetical protein